MKTRTFFLLLVVVALVVVAYVVFWGNRPAGPQQVASFAECIAAGYETIDTAPRECRTPDGQVFTETPDETEDKSDLIRVTSPAPNTEIASPLTVSGEARGYWFFEASFPVRLLDANGNEIPLDPGYIMTTGEWMTEEFVPFEGTLTFEPPSTETGTLVLMKDNPSGLPERADELRIPVRFGETSSGATMEVTVFYSNPRINPKAEIDCAALDPVTRTVPKTEAVARAALTELLKGPTASERAAGYFSGIPGGVTIQSLTIENGVARADFSEELEPGGGSCTVIAIHAQIRETLVQFPIVNEVAISINGRTQDILQP